MFSWVDYIVCAATIVLSLAIGVYYAASGGRQRTTSEYLVADRQMGIIPVSISMAVSYLSSVAILGNSSEMHYYGASYMFFTIGLIIGVILTAPLVVPLFYPLHLTSINEYLTFRYESRAVLVLGCLCQTLKQLIYASVVTFGAAVMFEAMSGFPMWASMMLMGVTCTVYTAVGGLKAVIWTDVLQAAVIFVGIIIVAAQGVHQTGGMGDIWTTYERLRLPQSLQFSPLSRQCGWAMFISGLYSGFNSYANSQAGVQRIASLKSVRDAKYAILCSAPIRLVLEGICSFCGVVTFAYFTARGCDPLDAGYIKGANQVLPNFVMEVLSYPGVPGLFVACVCSGALSTISSCLNSATAILWDDMLSEHMSYWTETRKTMVTKLVSFLYGLAILALAYLLSTAGGTIMQVSTVAAAVSSCPVAVIFTSGGLFPRINWKSILVGGILSMLLAGWWSVGAMVVHTHQAHLPTSTQNCTVDELDFHLNQSTAQPGVFTTGDMASTSSPVADNSQTGIINTLFSISPYLMPPLISGFSICVALLSSFIPGFQTDLRKPDLYFPGIRRLTCSSGGAANTREEYKMANHNVT